MLFLSTCILLSLYIHHLQQNAEIDPDEEFPGTHLALRGVKWGDFQARAGHTKLYLPESMLIKATDHIQELHQGKLRQSKKIAENLNMTESQVVDGGLSGVDIQEQKKMLADVKAQHDAHKQNKGEFCQAEEGLVAGTGKHETDFNVSNVTSSMVDEQKADLDRLKKKMEAERKSHYEAVMGEITATPVIHGPTSGVGLPHKGSTLPEAQPYSPVHTDEATCNLRPPGHHKHYPMVHPRRTIAEKQRLVDQVPDWLKTDNVVWVKIPGVHDPITGMVKFVGILPVKGVDQLIAGVQLVSFNLDNANLCNK